MLPATHTFINKWNTFIPQSQNIILFFFSRYSFLVCLRVAGVKFAEEMWLICRMEWWSRVYWIMAALKRIGFPLNRPALIIRPRNMIRSLIQLTEQYTVHTIRECLLSLVAVWRSRKLITTWDISMSYPTSGSVCTVIVNRRCRSFTSVYYPSHTGQLSLLFPLGRENEYLTKVVMLCGPGVKAGI